MDCGAIFFLPANQALPARVLICRGWSGHAIAFWRIVDFDVDKAIMTWRSFTYPERDSSAKYLKERMLPYPQTGRAPQIAPNPHLVYQL